MKRLLFLLLFVCSVGWAALPASDSFTYSDGALHTVAGGNWASPRAGINVVSNQITIVSYDALSYWSADTFDDDAYSQIEVVSNGNSFWGPVARDTDGNNFYVFGSNSTTTYIYKRVVGSWTEIASTGTPFANGETARIEVEGTTIRAYINGSPAVGGSHTDASLASGSSGVYFLNVDATSIADNWEGGNVGGTPTSTPTSTATNTPTNTPTNTATPTFTFTATPTFTSTPTFTPTPYAKAVWESLIWNSPVQEAARIQ